MAGLLLGTIEVAPGQGCCWHGLLLHVVAGCWLQPVAACRGYGLRPIVICRNFGLFAAVVGCDQQLLNAAVGSGAAMVVAYKIPATYFSQKT